jgi:hypothetical protein
MVMGSLMVELMVGAAALFLLVNVVAVAGLVAMAQVDKVVRKIDGRL